MRPYKPLSDDRFYDQMDCNIVEVGMEMRPLVEEMLGYSDLENLHEHIEPTEVPKLLGLFNALDTNIMDEYLNGILKPIIGDTEYLVQRVPNLRIVLPDQDKLGQVLIYHQGIWFGNGYGMRTIWSPITDAWDTNTMQIASLEDSVKFTKASIAEKWNYEKIEEESNKICKPANLNYGQALLFTQENIHGNVPNRTGKTRVSFEGRILLRGGDFNQKTPGGYFKRPFCEDHAKTSPDGYRNAIVMPTFDGPMFGDCNQFTQTLLMQQYVNHNNIEVITKCTDLSTTNCTHAKYVARHRIYDNIVFPSIWAFQTEDLEEILEYDGVTVHFASEDLSCETREEKELALYYRKFSPPVLN